MKILIVGLGSMGKRRARLTKGIDSSIRIAGVDTAESRRAEATDLGLIDAAYPNIAGCLWRCDPCDRAGGQHQRPWAALS